MSRKDMSLLSLSDALAAPSLAEARVVAGRAGLKRTVSSVTVGEVPDIAEWLSGGELVLSTLYAVAGEKSARLAFVEGLIRGKAAGLITKPERFVGELDAAILELATKRRFPIVVVDPEVRWTDVIREIYELALGERMAQLERSLAIQHELLAVGAEGGSYDRLAETLFRVLARPVAIQDDLGRVLAAYPVHEPPVLATPSDLAEAVRREEHVVRFAADETAGRPATVTAPVLVGGAVLGAIGAADIPRLSEVETSALTYAAAVAAILIGREQVRLETELRIRGDFLVEVQASRSDETEDLLGKAALLGADLSSGLAVLAMRIDPTATSGTGVSELERSLGAYVLDEHRNALVATRGPDVFAFLGSPRAQPPEEFMARCRAVAERLAAHLRAVWPGGAHAVALGRFHRPDSMREALREAEVTVDVAAGLKQAERVATYEDVGSYRLLLAVAERDPDELAGFVAETIGPLERAGRDLVDTLAAYLAADGNIGEVAARLFMHRHTVRYRLDRIAALTGLDVRTSDGREQLSLGLKAAALLRSLS